MVTDYWWLILPAVIIAAVGLFLITRRSGSGSETLDRHDRAAAVDRDPDAPTTVEPPVLVMPAAAPFDVAPPSIPLIDEARIVIEEAPAVENQNAGPPDDLTVMKGIGPKLATMLADLGVTRYAQIAAWTDADLARVDDRLGAFKGRPVRDRWVEQARLLSGQDRGAFERAFGKIDPATLS